MPGATKTRLSPPLTPEDAAGLSEAFLVDQVSSLSEIEDAELQVWYAPPEAGDFLRLVLQSSASCALVPQPEGDLGARLSAAFASACECSRAVLVLGSDTPDLPASLVRSALEMLDEADADIVLGPASDGGYYLLGARAHHPELFARMPWSQPELLAETVTKSKLLRLDLRLLPVWEDVDTPANLDALKRRLDAASPSVAPRTRQALATVYGVDRDCGEASGIR